MDYVPKFDPHGYTVYDGASTIGRIDGDGSFSIFIKPDYNIPVFQDLVDLLEQERHLNPNLENELIGHTAYVRLYDNKSYEPDSVPYKLGYDGTAALATLIDKIWGVLDLELFRLIETYNPSYIIPGRGASGKIIIDKSAGGMIYLNTEIIYPLHFLYTQPGERMDLKLAADIISSRHTLQFEVIEDDPTLRIFKDFIGKLDFGEDG
ncbi:MAG: hypothetical protein NDI94_06495 [Candidatus Woesearchaeota archaeon]|nr:hypothetical protein [Candidatus Woesearchaeota archaeon]